jgi:endogenous inhibitor of DNA gyrase (YacG/DUF329 family)
LSARAETHEGQAAKQAAPKKHARTKKTCPICGKTLSGKDQEHRYRPFCSKHCAEIDLGRWLEGRYAIQGAPVDKAENDFDSDPDGDR